MAQDYHFCLWLVQELDIAPEDGWDKFWDDCGAFEDLDSGDNEAFHMFRKGLAMASRLRDSNTELSKALGRLLDLVDSRAKEVVFTEADDAFSLNTAIKAARRALSKAEPVKE